MKTPKVNAILKDRANSFWLRSTLGDAIKRSPVDALEDARRLLDALEEWAGAKLADEVAKLARMRGEKADEVG
jgi:hypothetical protein